MIATRWTINDGPNLTPPSPFLLTLLLSQLILRAVCSSSLTLWVKMLSLWLEPGCTAIGRLLSYNPLHSQSPLSLFDAVSVSFHIVFRFSFYLHKWFKLPPSTWFSCLLHFLAPSNYILIYMHPTILFCLFVSIYVLRVPSLNRHLWFHELFLFSLAV